MPDEVGVDLVESAVEADGAVFHDAALGLEEEEVVEVEMGVGVAHVLACERPLVEGGASVEAAVGGVVVLALDPGPQGAVERLQALGGCGGEVGEHRGAQGAEEAFDFSLPRGLIGTGVDKRDAELGAHECELLGAVARPVVDVEPSRESPACDGLLEHGQERGGALRVGEGGEGEDAGGIVDKCNEEGLSAPAPVGDLRSVHHVAHPQLPCVAVGEASPVGGGGLVWASVEQPFARKQPVHGRGREGVLDAARAGGLDEGFDRQCGLLGLQGDEPFGDLGGQAPGLAAVGAGLRVQRLEPAGAIQAEPVAHGLDGDAGAPRAGDDVGALGLLVQGAADVSAAQGQAEHVGNQPIAEERHGFAQLFVGVVHGLSPRLRGRIGPGEATLCGCRRRVRPHLVLARTLAIRRPEAVGVEPQRSGQHGELRVGQRTQRSQRGVGVEPCTHRAHLGDAPGEVLGQQPDDDTQDVMDEAHSARDPAHRPRELDGIAAQRIGRGGQARRLFGVGHHLLDLVQLTWKPCGQTVRQPAESGVALTTVPASDMRSARGLARIGAVACQ